MKVIIPNMREFRVFYSDNEGSVMFFKRDWQEVKSKESWNPSEEQINALKVVARGFPADDPGAIDSLLADLQKLL